MLFKINGEIKTFQDQQKWKQHMPTKPALRIRFKRFQSRNEERESWNLRIIFMRKYEQIRIRNESCMFNSGKKTKPQSSRINNSKTSYVQCRLKPKLVWRACKGFYLLTKGTIHTENVTAIYMCATNVSVSSFLNIISRYKRM